MLHKIDIAVRKLYDQPIYALLPIAAANQLDSCPPTEQPHSEPNIKQPNVLCHFNQIHNHHPLMLHLPLYVELLIGFLMDG